MNINKNIWNIILDKLALNKWKNQVKNINQEYHKTFLLIHGVLVVCITSHAVCPLCYRPNITGYYMAFNWRKYEDSEITSIISKIVKNKCKICNSNYVSKTASIDIIHPDYRKKMIG